MRFKNTAKVLGAGVLSVGILAACGGEEEGGGVTESDLDSFYTEEEINTWGEENGFVNEEGLNTWAEENGYINEDDLNTWAEENGLLE